MKAKTFSIELGYLGLFPNFFPVLSHCQYLLEGAFRQNTRITGIVINLNFITSVSHRHEVLKRLIMWKSVSNSGQELIRIMLIIRLWHPPVIFHKETLYVPTPFHLFD